MLETLHVDGINSFTNSHSRLWICDLAKSTIQHDRFYTTIAFLHKFNLQLEFWTRVQYSLFLKVTWLTFNGLKHPIFLAQKKSHIVSNSWTKFEHFIPDLKPIFQIHSNIKPNPTQPPHTPPKKKKQKTLAILVILNFQKPYIFCHWFSHSTLILKMSNRVSNYLTRSQTPKVKRLQTFLIKKKII